MERKILYVFNPEHDLALAVGEGPYTPPSEVLKLRKEMTLLPALYAGSGDFILALDGREGIEESPYYDLAKERGIKIIGVEEITEISPLICEIAPWGWDHAIRNILISNDTPENLLPSEGEIQEIRRLSHRRITIPFRKRVAEILGEELINPAKEVFSIQELEDFLAHHPVAYLKAPWSSSGRGIIVTDHIKRAGMLEWSRGTIKKQGSLVAEPAWDRVFDFATEWEIGGGEVRYLGLSVFETSSRGKYHRNVSGSQEELERMVEGVASGFDVRVIEAQRIAIKELIAPGYKGLLGIDMLADSKGRVNHCVELNLRRTMGMMGLESLRV